MEKIIDDARKHFLNNYPSDIPIEQAYLHIGVFLGWVIDQELYSAKFKQECETQIFRFKKKDTSPVILGEIWDGFIFEEQLKPEAKAFTREYYYSGTYLKDFKETLAAELPSIYYVKDTWENYQTMRQRLDERYAEWKSKPKPALA
jgi:hypothetical protein